MNFSLDVKFEIFIGFLYKGVKYKVVYMVLEFIVRDRNVSIIDMQIVYKVGRLFEGKEKRVQVIVFSYYWLIYYFFSVLVLLLVKWE